MTPGERARAPSQEPGNAERQPGRIRRVFSGSRELVRIAYRDPEHAAERLTLYSTSRHAELSRSWAREVREARPGDHRALIAEELRGQTAQVARIDGAISGTPFFIALVPGYLTYLSLEMRMTLRIAALYDRDPGSLETAAEMLALRRVYPDAESAKKGLIAISEKPMPDRPEHRRSLRTWVHSVYLLLVMGGFLTPSLEEPLRKGFKARVLSVLSMVAAGLIWAMTWVVPFTFMIVMAWGCESRTRQLGRRALVFYGGEEASTKAAIATADRRRDRGHDRRAILRGIGLFLSIAVPIGFVAFIGHLRNTGGPAWLIALGALVALSLVIATAVIANRPPGATEREGPVSLK